MGLMNKCMKIGSFTDSWKELISKAVERLENSRGCLFREGKNSVQAGSYRLICFLPIVRKVLEKVIKNRVTYHLEHNNLMSFLAIWLPGR